MGLVSYILDSQANDIYKLSLVKLYYVDFADKLNWEYTVNLLVFFTFVISHAKMFVNRVISCVVPIYFTQNQEDYANEMCYITTNKFYMNDHERYYVFQNNTEHIGVAYINAYDNNIDPSVSVAKVASYYVWVPYVLLAQAVCLVSPRFLWSYLLSHLTSIDMNELLKAASQCKTLGNSRTNVGINYTKCKAKQSLVDPYLRHNQNFKYLTFHIGRTLLSSNKIQLEKRKQNVFKRKFLNFFAAKKLFLCYLLIKMMSLLTIFVQIFLVNYTLGVDLYLLAMRSFLAFLETLFRPAMQVDKVQANQTMSLYSTNSAYFPLRSMCTFRIRELTNVHVYSSMCSLPINLFIQYVFLFLSFWYLAVILMNMYFVAYWNVYARNSSHFVYISKKLLLEFQAAKKKAYINHHGSNSKFYRRHTHLHTCADLIHLHSKEDSNLKCEKCNRYLHKFAFDFLTFDFRFFLEIVLSNGDEALIQQLLIYFWQIYRTNFILD